MKGAQGDRTRRHRGAWAPSGHRCCPYGMGVLLLLLLALGACAPRARLERLEEPSISVGDPLPPAVGDVVVTVEGRLTRGAADGGVQLDLEGLDALGVLEIRVRDPWREENVSYSGVLLSDLLTYVGADSGAPEVRVVGMDGYEAGIPAETLRDFAVLLATRCEGEPMAIADGGPARIIFPYDGYPDLAEARNMSVWNIARIVVR